MAFDSFLRGRAGIPFILVTVLLDAMGIGLIIPVLPALVGEFTSSRDAQSYWYGLLAAAYGFMNFFATPVLGALSDRYGRRTVLLVSVFGLGVDFLLMAFAPSLWVLLCARLIGGITGATLTVSGAYIADVTTPDARSRGFGLIGAMFGMGFIFGPMIGGLLGGVDLRYPFYAAATLSMLNVLYGFFILPESLPLDRRSPFSLAKANPFSALFALAGVKGLGGLIAAFALVSLAQYILHATWVLYTQFRFGWGPRDNGIALFAVGVTGAVVQGGLLGLLVKRWGEPQTALIGISSGVIAFVLYGLAQQGWMMYAIIFGNLLFSAAVPALQAIVSKSFDASRQGVALGSLSSVGSVMTVLAPPIGTALLAQVTHLPAHDWRIGITFYLSAALQALAFALAWRHLKR